MEGWWKRRRTRSSWLCTAVVPLLLAFGLVALWTSPRVSIMGAAWLWRWPVSSISSSSGANFHMNITSTTLSAASEGSSSSLSSNVVEDPLSFSPPKEPQPPLSQPVPRDQVHDDGNSSSFKLEFNSSVSMPPAVSVDGMQPEELPDVARNDSPENFPVNESHASPPNPKLRRKFSNLGRLESKLHQARSAIREAKDANQSHDPDYVPTGPMYWNAKAFHRSYLELEKHFKVYVYEEGEPPIFHDGPARSIYSTEGNFIFQMENSKFRTKDLVKAHVYFLPISMTAIVRFIFDRKLKDHWYPLKQTVKDYINLIAGKYPYWNQSIGADHFVVSCHDWGPELSKSVPELFGSSIRALCNANTTEGFNPRKDVSIPEINLPSYTLKGLIGGPSPSQRPILAFFAGGVHGPVRPVLMEHWENKDQDIQVKKYLPKGVSYYGMMKKSKFCLCPSGYEVASPRMVEALYSGCVPVIIKDHYVSPFSDVLNWNTFSVEVPVSEIPNLKKILTGISSRQYIRLQRRGKQIRQHFEVNWPPKRYDVFHMILHSIWLRRLNIRLHGTETLDGSVDSLV